MKFSEVVKQAAVLVQESGQISYRALKMEFDLDDDRLDVLKEELLYTCPKIVDDDGRGLIWNGEAESATALAKSLLVEQSQSSSNHTTPQTQPPSIPEAERRHLTVMFCDIVDSTKLSEQLDPEDLLEIIRAYQDSSAKVIKQFGGHIAQYLGDGLLVYFGYPRAHEDDAERAVRAGLGIVQMLDDLNTCISHPIQIRIGLHTGSVVVGDIGGGDRHERLALGETPNIAARIQALAADDTVVISGSTYQLVNGLFENESLGAHSVKGITTPLSLHKITGEGKATSRFEVAVKSGLTTMVGREEEVGLLQRYWEQVNSGDGQVVLLSGEAGIGKSRLGQVLKDQILDERTTRIEFHCSPHYQNTAFYPIIGYLERILEFSPRESDTARFDKLEHMLSRYEFPRTDTLPLLAHLLSIPRPDNCSPLNLSAERQKQRTLETLVTLILEGTERHAVYCAWEDLHWCDASTLEVLQLLLEHASKTRLLIVISFRPEFRPPWDLRSHFSYIALSRLGPSEVKNMIDRVTDGKALPQEMMEQIVAKTDGVPLFVEELTRMVIDSGMVHLANGRYELSEALPSLGIPSTLQDSLMARLDGMGFARELAQLGATLGREFNYELIRAVSSLDEIALQDGLTRLVDAELIYRTGLPPDTSYLFKHALVQDTAYQSLLKSQQRRFHQRIAQVLEQQFQKVINSRPELVAHHYTAANAGEKAIPYWQRAGESAARRSANVEAVSHFTQALDLIQTLRQGPQRDQVELTLEMALATAIIVTKGFADPEAGQAYARADELCSQLGDRAEIVDVLVGLWAFHVSGQSPLKTAREIAEQLLKLALDLQDSTALLKAHIALSINLFYQGQFLKMGSHLDQCIDLYDHNLHHDELVSTSGYDRGIITHCWSAMSHWMLGYPEQALASSEEALALAKTLAHPYTSAVAFAYAAWVHSWRGELQAACEHAEAAVTLSHEHGFTFTLAWGTIFHNLALTGLGKGENLETSADEAVEKLRGAGIGLWMPHLLAGIAQINYAAHKPEEALRNLREAMEISQRRGDSSYEAELHRLNGEMILQSCVNTPDSDTQREAETYFTIALRMAREQGARSLQLRATINLARLWREQNQQAKAHELLSEIYSWFTEGFDTKDLREAKALLEQLV